MMDFDSGEPNDDQIDERFVSAHAKGHLLAFTKRDQPARQIREDAATAGDGRHCPF
jgi:hypothetical protein